MGKYDFVEYLKDGVIVQHKICRRCGDIIEEYGIEDDGIRAQKED